MRHQMKFCYAMTIVNIIGEIDNSVCISVI